METMSDIIELLKEQGYIYDFEISNNKLVSKATNEKFLPEDVIIEKTYRFEGDSSADDMSVLYVITTHSGTRGVLVDAYGTYATPAISEFIRKVPVREEHENQVRE